MSRKEYGEWREGDKCMKVINERNKGFKRCRYGSSNSPLNYNGRFIKGKQLVVNPVRAISTVAKCGPTR
jgi:hypothetical protein